MGRHRNDLSAEASARCWAEACRRLVTRAILVRFGEVPMRLVLCAEHERKVRYAAGEKREKLPDAVPEDHIAA